MNNSVVKELDLLLNNYWIVKENNPTDYYHIKNHLKELREIANNKLGCDIFCNNKVIKLEKIPINTDTYKIEEFDNPLDYVLFISLLLFLEDKALDEQFILSNFTEFVSNILATITVPLKPDWKKYKDRKSLVDVLKYAVNLGIIRLRDGSDSKYADDETYEALYENTSLSHYVLRNFKFDVFSCFTPEDFLKKEKEELDFLNYKRNMVYRGLLFYPCIIFDELDNETEKYLRNFKPRVTEDIDKFLEGELIISKNSAFISLEGTKERTLFPNYRKSISDMVLLINSHLWQDLSKVSNDKIIMTKTEFKNLLSKIHNNYKEFFSKEYREMPIYKFQEEIVEYMKEFKLLRETTEFYYFNPITYLLKGEYKKQEEETEVQNYEMLSLDLDLD